MDASNYTQFTQFGLGCINSGTLYMSRYCSVGQVILNNNTQIYSVAISIQGNINNVNLLLNNASLILSGNGKGILNTVEGEYSFGTLQLESKSQIMAMNTLEIGSITINALDTTVDSTSSISLSMIFLSPETIYWYKGRICFQESCVFEIRVGKWNEFQTHSIR